MWPDLIGVLQGMSCVWWEIYTYNGQGYLRSLRTDEVVPMPLDSIRRWEKLSRRTE